MFNLPVLSTAKLVIIAVIAAVVLIFIGLALRWHSLLLDRDDHLAAICHETRVASGLPKLNCDEVIPEIDALGQAVVTLKSALADQNAKVAALGKQSADQQAAAAQASKTAQERAQRAEATAARLIASSRAGGAPAGSAAACQPSKVLQESWR